MNKIEIAKNETTVLDKKSSFISLVSSLRRKINDPLGKKTAKIII